MPHYVSDPVVLRRNLDAAVRSGDISSEVADQAEKSNYLKINQNFEERQRNSRIQELEKQRRDEASKAENDRSNAEAARQRWERDADGRKERQEAAARAETRKKMLQAASDQRKADQIAQRKYESMHGVTPSSGNSSAPTGSSNPRSSADTISGRAPKSTIPSGTGGGNSGGGGGSAMPKGTGNPKTSLPVAELDRPKTQTPWGGGTEPGGKIVKSGGLPDINQPVNQRGNGSPARPTPNSPNYVPSQPRGGSGAYGVGAASGIAQQLANNDAERARSAAERKWIEENQTEAQKQKRANDHLEKHAGGLGGPRQYVYPPGYTNGVGADFDRLVDDANRYRQEHGMPPIGGNGAGAIGGGLGGGLGGLSGGLKGLGKAANDLFGKPDPHKASDPSQPWNNPAGGAPSFPSPGMPADPANPRPLGPLPFNPFAPGAPGGAAGGGPVGPGNPDGRGTWVLQTSNKGVKQWSWAYPNRLPSDVPQQSNPGPGWIRATFADGSSAGEWGSENTKNESPSFSYSFVPDVQPDPDPNGAPAPSSAPSPSADPSASPAPGFNPAPSSSPNGSRAPSPSGGTRDRPDPTPENTPKPSFVPDFGRMPGFSPAFDPGTSPTPSPKPGFQPQGNPKNDPRPLGGAVPDPSGSPSGSPSGNPFGSPSGSSSSGSSTGTGTGTGNPPSPQCRYPNASSITVGVFDGFDNDGNPKTKNQTVSCLPSESARVQLSFKRLFELEAKKLGGEIALPEAWAVRRGIDRPQLVIVFAEIFNSGKLGTSRWSITVPHYRGTSKSKISAPSYRRGNWQGQLTLNDGSTIVVNANSSEECKRSINKLKILVPIDFRTRNGKAIKPRVVDNPNIDLKTCNVVPVMAKYYATGQKELGPTWSQSLRK